MTTELIELYKMFGETEYNIIVMENQLSILHESKQAILNKINEILNEKNNLDNPRTI